MKLVSYPSKFYHESGTWLGVLYEEETGYRSDWGKVQVALDNGESVSIRPCNDAEYGRMCKQLEKIKQEKAL